jgi:hypothetical protein
MSDVITTDSAFSKAQQELITVLVEMMIPADGEMPSAADPAILPAIISRMEENSPVVTMALGVIDELSVRQSNKSFLESDPQDRQAVIETFKAEQVELTQYIQLCTVASYYQDDRVMTALGLEARPPHPGGYEVETTDWSILDPVRSKEKIFRQI